MAYLVPGSPSIITGLFIINIRKKETGITVKSFHLPISLFRCSIQLEFKFQMI